MAQRGINKVILIGNLGADPEIRYTQNNTAVATLSVATSETWKDKQTGETREQTEWHRVVVWDKLAEIAGEYLRKGSKVYIEGQLQTRKWTDQQNVERYSTEIVVKGYAGQLQMLDGRQDNQQGGGYQQQQGGYQQQNTQQQRQPQQHTTDARNYSQGGQQQFQQRPAQQPQQQAAPFNPGTDFDDDIPF